MKFLTTGKTFFLALVCVVTLAATTAAQSTTYSQVVEADAFVSSGDPNSNFGTQGAMEIAAPTAAQPRTQLSVLRFDMSGLRSSFDSDYGAGNWVVTGVTLSLFSNVATAGQQPANSRFNKIAAGNFQFDLLGNNNWNETGITWNTLPDILPGGGNTNTLTSLGTFYWDATGQASSTWTLNADATLTGKIYTGDRVTLLGQPSAGSAVGYLFNTLNLNPGYLNVTAAAVPEPSAVALIASVTGLAGCWTFRRKTNQP